MKEYYTMILILCEGSTESLRTSKETKMTINNETQLSTFSIIKSILLTSQRLSNHGIYEFEPSEKSSTFKGFPYIVVEVPEDSNTEEYLGNLGEGKEFDINIQLHLDYSRNDKYTGDANAILSTIRGSQSTLQEYGYSLESINNSVAPEPTLQHQKLKLVGALKLVLSGDVLL